MHIRNPVRGQRAEGLGRVECDEFALSVGRDAISARGEGTWLDRPHIRSKFSYN